MAKAPRWLEDTYRLGLLLKGVDGGLEIVGAALLYFVRPQTVDRLAALATEHELSKDPHDFIANHFLNTAHHLAGSGRVFGAIFLLVHGWLKILLAVLLLRRYRWAYPYAIALLILFVVYEVYRVGYSHSVTIAGFALFDAALAWLVWREYRALNIGTSKQ